MLETLSFVDFVETILDWGDSELSWIEIVDGDVWNILRMMEWSKTDSIDLEANADHREADWHF